MLVLVTLASLVAGGSLVGASLTGSGLVALGVVLLAFCVAVARYTTLLSALVSSRGSAAGIAAGITFASYLAGVLAGISNKVEAQVRLLHHRVPPAGGARGPRLRDRRARPRAGGRRLRLLALVAFERRDANP